MLVFIIYLLGIVPTIDKVFGLAASILIIGCVVAAVLWMLAAGDGEDELAKTFQDFLKKLLKILLPVVIVGVLIPPKETMYGMLAAYGLTEIAQSEQAQEIGSKSLDALNKALDGYLTEAETESSK